MITSPFICKSYADTNAGIVAAFCFMESIENMHLTRPRFVYSYQHRSD